jgi:hypothetical protein
MRVKEAPAQALRAVFGGIGSLLSVGDKIRNKPAASETSASAESVTPETTTVTPETTTVTPEASALPLANYDALSVASLRARLRNLSVDQLTQLIDYEKAHANRAEVITMFERRITKINLGLTTSLPKISE